jgi:hypothetical protein
MDTGRERAYRLNIATRDGSIRVNHCFSDLPWLERALPNLVDMLRARWPVTVIGLEPAASLIAVTFGNDQTYGGRLELLLPHPRLLWTNFQRIVRLFATDQVKIVAIHYHPDRPGSPGGCQVEHLTPDRVRQMPRPDYPNPENH